MRAFLTPNPHCVTKDTGNTAAPPFTSPPSLLPPPPPFPTTHMHTHTARGEGTKFHAPLTEIKTKGPPPPLECHSSHKFKVIERRWRRKRRRRRNEAGA